MLPKLNEEIEKNIFLNFLQFRLLADILYWIMKESGFWKWRKSKNNASFWIPKKNTDMILLRLSYIKSEKKSSDPPYRLNCVICHVLVYMPDTDIDVMTSHPKHRHFLVYDYLLEKCDMPSLWNF